MDGESVEVPQGVVPSIALSPVEQDVAACTDGEFEDAPLDAM